MAYGQIDPARLDGDALTRWYLRSPADIEEERRQAAAQAYDSFFSRPDEGARPVNQPTTDTDEADGPDALTTSWTEIGDNRWQGDPGFGSQQVTSASSPYAANSYQVAVTPRGFSDYWGVPGCANCHGYTPNTLPPTGGHFPFPPNYSPRSGGSDGSSSSDPRWSKRPQCNRQFETDRKICQRAKSPTCWENSNKRLGVCDRTGAVSIPPLPASRSCAHDRRSRRPALRRRTSNRAHGNCRSRRRKAAPRQRAKAWSQVHRACASPRVRSNGESLTKILRYWQSAPA